MRLFRYWGLVFLAALAAAPATQPSDPTVDQLLSGATTVPTIADDGVPATLPSVLQPANPPVQEERSGVMIFSDGKKISGKLSTTLRQPIRVWNDEKQEYEDLPFSLIQTIEAHVVWERQEQEWKFSESGSDVKEYSGRTYPARLTSYAITLKDGTVVSGPVAAPIYVDSDGGRKIYILHKTDKGDVGQTVDQLVYVKSVHFTD